MRRGKNRFLSLLLALCMVLTLLPVTVVQAADPRYYTVEKYDSEGNGTMLVPPTVSTDWSGSYGDSFVSSLLGSDIKVSDGVVTGIKDESQDDSWLDNGDLGEGSKWVVAVLRYDSYYGTYSSKVYEDASFFYPSSARVIRFIYVPGGDYTKAGITYTGGYSSIGSITVAKDDLIQELSQYDGTKLGGNRKQAYDEAIAMILNTKDATAESVAQALSNMQTATDSATDITLNKESTELYVGQKETLEATLTPGGSTDKLTWTSSDDTVVTVSDGVLKAMKAGTATVTVTAENPEVMASMAVTVKDLQSVYITGMPSNTNVIEAERGELILSAWVEPSDVSNLEWQWSVEDPSIAEVTPMEGNEFMASVKGKKEGKTNIIVALGSTTASYEVEVTPYNGPYVYFDYDDESKEDQLLDENNTITLTCLDEGKFVVGRGNGGTVSWSGGSDYVTSLAGGDDLAYWVFINKETGKWSPWDVRTLDMTVDCGGWTQEFTVKCVPSGITELKTYVGDEEVSTENPYVTEGTISGVGVTTKGKTEDGDWVTIPTQALHYDTSDTTYNFRWIGNQMSISSGGQATMSVFMRDNWNVKQNFIAKCNYVPVTGFTVTTPETFTITGETDFMTGWYYGLGLYSDNLKISFEPSNATNKNLLWESLTPDIAFYTADHLSGIVPRKCGTAKFKVTCEDNPSLTQEVTVKFLYMYPLEAAELSKTEYALNVGDTETLNITTTPENATEKGFTYSYDTEGIVEIKEGKIVAKKAGEVTVTGKPVDDTMGCNNITFTVTVSGSAVEQDDPMPTVTAGINHGLSYLENQSVSAYGDEWNIFTIIRAGGSISEEDKAAYLASAEEAVKNGLSQPTDYVRVVLTLGVMGEDPTSFGGVNLIEKLYNWADLDYLTSNQISWTLLALDSKNYEVPANAANTRENLIAWLLMFQDASGGFCLTNSTDVDMTGMILQALAPYNNAEHADVQAAFAKAITWLQAQMGTTAGFAANPSYSENSCTTAQVLTALSVAGIDAVDPENGFTIGKNNMVTNLWSYKADYGFYWDSTVETSGNAMGTQQTTYALEAYRRLANGENSLYDLSDVPTKMNYQQQLAALVTEAEALTELDYTEGSWSAMAQKLQIARTLLQSGTTDQDQLKEAYENLKAAMSALELNTNTDKAAAQKFVAKVEALPSAEEISLAQKDQVEALLAEYEGLTDAVKAYISAEYITKLNDCAAKLADLEAADAVIRKIDIIGEVTLGSEADIMAARQAFDALTAGQQQLVADAGKKAVLEAAEADLAALKDAAVQNVINNIAQFEDTEQIVLADKAVLKDIRDLYEQLPDSLKERVTNLDVLVTAETIMRGLEKEYVLGLISALKAPEELMIPGEDGAVTENITAEDIQAIAEAEAAYDDLCREYPDMAAEIASEEGGAALQQKLAEDVAIASEYEGYIEAYLADMIASIQNFPAVDETNVSRAEQLVGKYDAAYEQSHVYLDSIEGLKAKAESIRAEAQVVRAALNEAAAVEQLIEGLVTDAITSDKMLENAEAKLAEVEAAYDGLSELAKAYVHNLSVWDTAISNVNVYKAKKAAAAQVDALAQAAQNAAAENLTDDSTVAAIKGAEDAYGELTADVKAMVQKIGSLSALKQSIADAKNAELAKNGLVTIKETIPYDVVVKISSAAQSEEESMKTALQNEKKAELKKAFTLEQYRVSADGSLQDWNGVLTAQLNLGTDLNGKQVYVLYSEMQRTRSVSDQQVVNPLLFASGDETGMSYLRVVVSGQNISFTMDKNGIYALGIAEADTQDGNSNGDNSTDGDNSSDTTNTNKPSGSSTSTGNTTKPSGSSTSTGSGSSSLALKTGDTIPSEMTATLLMMIAAFAVLVVLNKKRKAQ